MPRTFVSKNILTTDRSALEEAFNYRVTTGCSYKVACEQFGVKHTTLVDAFNRSKKVSDGRTFVPIQKNVNRVFSPEQENHIEEYAIKIARMFYGLSVPEFRKLVFHYAKACRSLAIPRVWEEHGMATRDWYYAYMSRHPNLTLKAPEGMSIARAMAFNRVNVNLFFNVYTDALARYKFTPDRIFNLDESGLSTVMKPVKVVCEKGKPVASQVAQERGAHMTFVGIVNAAGHYIPPVFIIARKRWNPEFMRGTIDGSKGLLHHNGWMTGELFLDVLKHIHVKTYCSRDNKILLIMDNAECHMDIHAMEFAINNGIVIVTLPPHTTAKMQPLDVSIFAPFKSYLRHLQDDYKLTHPGTAITEHILPELASKAWIKACNPSNVLSGFKATGIWPVNRNIFPDDAFAGAEVTEQEAPQATLDEVPATSSSESEEVHVLDALQLVGPSPPRDLGSPTVTPGDSGTVVSGTPGSDGDSAQHGTSGGSGGSGTSGGTGTYGDSAMPSTSGTSATCSTPSTPGTSGTCGTPSTPSTPSTPCLPSSVRPYPKAAPRVRAKGRHVVKACVVTESAEALDHMRAKEERKKQRAEKAAAKASGKKRKTAAPQPDIDLEAEEVEMTCATGPKKRRKQKIVESSEGEDTDSHSVMVLNDSSEYSEEDFGEEDFSGSYPFAEQEPQIDSYVLVEWEVEGTRGHHVVVFFVGKVVSIDEEGLYKINFLRIKNNFKKDTFTFPEIPDIEEVVPSRILGVLTPVKGTTQRQANIVKIYPPLLNYNMR